MRKTQKSLVKRALGILFVPCLIIGCTNKRQETSRRLLHEAIVEKLTSASHEGTDVNNPEGDADCKHFETIARDFPSEKGWTVSYQVLVKKDTGETFTWDSSSKKWTLNR